MNMRKMSLMLIPIMMVAFMTTAVITVEARREPDWQFVLAQYTDSVDAEVVQVVQATSPWKFSADIKAHQINLVPLEPITDDRGASIPLFSLALPYPPRTVHCALLHQKNRREIVFVSYYTDHLWNQGWVVQRLVEDNDNVATLADLGCQLSGYATTPIIADQIIA